MSKQTAPLAVSQLILAGAAKTTPAKTTGAPKPAGKTVRKGQTQTKGAKAAASAAPYAAIQYAMAVGRPGQGQALFAHTLAFLDISGMLDGGACPRAIAAQVIGDSAITYHTNRTGHFTRTDKGLTLSDTGFAHFLARRHNEELAPLYVEFFKDGKVNAKIHVNDVKNVRPVKHV